jgi:3-oxoacyl-[acyl-carrier protein] reductase
MMDRFLEGKTALVTGGSRGLGRAAAIRLAELGAIVAVNYASNEAAARDTLKGIEAVGGQGFLIGARLGSFDSAKRVSSELDAGLIELTGDPGLDILLNNAGGGDQNGTVSETSPEVFEKIFADNVTSAFFLTQLLMPRLRDNGRVINLSSGAARSALSNYIAYAMAKKSIETFTIALARDLGPRGITVNCILPGLISSDANADIRANPEMLAQMEQRAALRRIGQPEDFAGLVQALVSPGMGYVTGQIIEISGGLGL